MGTFQKYPAWACWVKSRQIVSELTMYLNVEEHHELLVCCNLALIDKSTEPGAREKGVGMYTSTLQTIL